ncbi:MAG: L-seryl-tRNA(Sec) selenium transferase [Acidobacteria bacterium]|nr:L-seryl-tRNA(Sec) selenium transferase [Acidobacteriota bacterium]MBI3427017.1 L-seryl-tRNA(Sec) selenium transferase [Acidobacteriota bacterium]
MSQELLRQLPAIDVLLNHAGLQTLIEAAGRDTVRDRLREVLQELRQELLQDNGHPSMPADLTFEIERRVQTRFAQRQQTRTQRVINATGVVLHTNLGRAPLSAPALAALHEAAREYCNLEYDLATGQRGKRGTGLEARLRELTGCAAAAVVNNCAAAVLLTLNTLAEGGEVIVSRGELIEIGGSFRIPDVIAKSGARLREVGTTNRTRLSDYENAINENTRVILRAHPSNYRIVGFTEKPALDELAALARAHNLPLFEDLGSGCLVDLNAIGIHDEPTVSQSLAAGASVVAFSGDKLLGGPQAGLILGEAELIQRIKRNPLMRALRVDKLIFAALEATVAAYAKGRATTEIPTLAALHAPKDVLTQRARAFVRQARKSLPNLELQLLDGDSVIGGGSAPEMRLPTTLISVTSSQWRAVELEERLRSRQPPVIARIEDDQLVLDLRTVSAASEHELLQALTDIGN